MKHKKNQILTDDGSYTFLIKELNETYHSIHGAVKESQFIYLNLGLNFWSKNCNVKKCSVLELGYGTGLLTYLSFLKSSGDKIKLDYISLEVFPLSLMEVKSLRYDHFFKTDNNILSFEDFSKLSWDESHKLTNNFSLTKQNISFENFNTSKLFDLIFYNPFAPNVQPDLWKPKFIKKGYDLLKKGGIWISYCAKGVVRRRLQDAGYEVSRLPGPPGKREILRAIKI
tara:strand:- start:150 stop:830 length:681 start_codon:yes stop_codon:yes gene_type:complete